MKKYAGFLLTVAISYIIIDWIEIKQERQYMKGYLEAMSKAMNIVAGPSSKEEA